MNLTQPKSRNANALALAFAIPFGGMLILMLIAGCAPFGNKTFLYSDAWHQYYPFFLNYRQALRSGDSLLYNWDLGMGMDYLGLISYYLASPLNLLSVLLPEGWLLGYFNLLHPIRLGLAGLFFAIFLKEIFRKEDISIAVFGSFYALCAWAMGYKWNVMWMDTFALLPLVVLGMVKLLRDKKFILYTLSLFLAVFSNYYIGFFVCIFVFLLFFCYEFCRWRGLGRFFRDLGRIALFSALAIGMTAILELPTLAALQTTQSSVNNFPEGFKLNIADENTWRGLLDAMRQVAGNMGGGIEPTWKEGLPNVYCGVGTIVLAFLYLMAGDVKLRDKLCAVGLLLFLNVSFIIRQLDYIWHGFHFTNMIPYRFSFLYSFVLLYMAYQGWLVRQKFTVYHVAIAGILTGDILAFSNDLTTTVPLELGSFSLDIPLYLIYNGLFLLAYLIALIYGNTRKALPEDADPRELVALRQARRRRRAISRRVLVGILAAEIVLNLVNFGTTVSFTTVNNYPKGTENTASILRYVQEREKEPYYRLEMAHAQTLNDDALNGYSGISAFTSSANVHVTQFMKALGYGAKNTYNRYCWEEASPVSNLFLNLKYMIDRDNRDRSSSVFTRLYGRGTVSLLENNAWLPLGFLTETDLAELNFNSNSNAFSFQNDLFSAATGLNSPVWHRLTGSGLTITGNNVTLKDQTSTGYCSYGDSQSKASVVYSYTAHQEGFFCVYLDLPKRNNVTIRLNGQVVYTETTSLAQMMAVDDVSIGDVVEVEMACDSGTSGTMTLTAAILNMDTFWQGYEILNASTLHLTTFSNTLVEGTIDCDRDGLLYTSVPQNGNWSVLVDGQEAEIRLVGECMVAVELTRGYHEIRLVYCNAAFSLGWKISLGCAGIFAALVIWIYKPYEKKRLPRKKRSKGRFEV